VSKPFSSPDYLTSDFDFDLPVDRIAQHPLDVRDRARLLSVKSEALNNYHVFDLPDLLRPGDLLVMNNTKVIPAQLFGKRGAVNVDVLLHKKQEDQQWSAFARPGKRLRVGDEIIFAPGFSAIILAKNDSGEIVIRFSSPDETVIKFLHRYGRPPLPPYIRRDKGTTPDDSARYQTVYATHEGAIAAPTAGLHFTSELLAKLDSKNIQRTMVTLHVGAGTFLPVKAEHIHDHVMHPEWGDISLDTANVINQARRERRRIIAIGTTSLRLLESVADEHGLVQPFSGETSLFIYPGYRFKVVSGLLTNFHLPRSTLFMLVSAFAGYTHIKAAYQHAIKNNYRFYSYGDATLLERADPQPSPYSA
jgi:S-adenosylmethionine:tRNA ribosyltransferase-isomerase